MASAARPGYVMKNHLEKAKKLLGKTEGKGLTPEERQLLKNQPKYLRYRQLLPSQIGQEPDPEPLFSHPINILATKALFEMGAEHDPEMMPITHLMVRALQDPVEGRIRDRHDIRQMVDALAELPENEALERLDLLEVPSGWASMDWQSLAGSLLNRVCDLRDELLHG